MEVAKGRWANYGSPPHHTLQVAPHVSYLLPTYRPIPRSINIDIGGLHPSLEGRGQVAVILGAEGSKRGDMG